MRARLAEKAPVGVEFVRDGALVFRVEIANDVVVLSQRQGVNGAAISEVETQPDQQLESEYTTPRMVRL